MGDAPGSSSSSSSSSSAGAPWVVILGAGFGGMAAAAALDRALEERPDSMRVVLVESGPSLAVQVANQFVLSRRTRAEHVTQSYSDHRLRHVFLVRDEVVHVDTAARQVVARGHKFRYAYMVVATGARARDGAVPGLARGAYNIGSMRDVTQLREALGDWRGGTLAVAAPEKGAGPWAYAYALLLAEEAAKHRRAAGRTRVVLATADEAPPSASLARLLADRGVELLPGRRAVYCDPAGKAVIFASGERLAYDVLAALPPRGGAAFLGDCPALAGDDGLVRGCHPDTRKTPLPGVYCAGAAAAGPAGASCSGVAAAAHGEAAAADIAARVQKGAGAAAGWRADEGARAAPQHAVYLETGAGEAVRLVYGDGGAVLSADGPAKAHYKSLVKWWEGLVLAWFQIPE